MSESFGPGWTKRTYRLEQNHKWKAKRGYKIFVANWGALRFDVPTDWQPGPETDAVTFHDREPPDDTCVLKVTIIHLSPEIDFSPLALDEMLEGCLSAEREGFHSRGRLHREKRDGFELVWSQVSFLDTGENREAIFRALLARGHNMQPLISLSFWPEDAARLEPVWAEIVRSLQLAPPLPGFGHDPLG